MNDICWREKHVRIDVGKDQRHRCAEAYVAPAGRQHVLHLAGGAIQARHALRPAINDVGIQRIGRNITVFLGADRMPVAEGDLAVVAAAGDAGRAALLLAAVNPVGKLVVGADVIELRGRLVVPGAPGLAAVHADGGALIDRESNDVGVVRVDPDV